MNPVMGLAAVWHDTEHGEPCERCGIPVCWFQGDDGNGEWKQRMPGSEGLIVLWFTHTAEWCTWATM